MIYLELFLSFLQVGLFSVGGGYAAMPIIQSSVVEKYGWLTMSEFTDLITIAEMTPGPIGINSATYVGFTATGSVWGSVIATFAVVLPSFILMLTISKFFLKYQKHPAVEAVFAGRGPARIGRPGADEYRELRLAYGRHPFVHHQLPHLPRCLRGDQEI